MIEFVVNGEPTGKARPRFVRQTGRTYTPKKTASAEGRVREAWERDCAVHFGGPLAAHIEFVLRRPQGHYRVNGDLSAAGLRSAHPTRKPDLDNAMKLVLDALNGCAYDDDSQVVDARAIRRWTNGEERAHTLVRLEAL